MCIISGCNFCIIGSMTAIVSFRANNSTAVESCSLDLAFHVISSCITKTVFVPLNHTTEPHPLNFVALTRLLSQEASDQVHIRCLLCLPKYPERGKKAAPAISRSLCPNSNNRAQNDWETVVHSVLTSTC